MFENLFGATKTIDWTSIINTLLVLLLPIVAELLTGGLRKLAAWLEAQYHGTLIEQFGRDIEILVTSLQQRYVAEWKEINKDGKVTAEERAKLQGILMEEIAKLLARYPVKLIDYLKQMAQHYVEAKVYSLAKKQVDPSKGDSEKETSEPEPPVSEEELANSEAVK